MLTITVIPRFQFHLVRLKEITNAAKSIELQISIPFSTIKSEGFQILSNLFKIFQFHLVRLKGNQPVHPVHRAVFQFHLVRLKVSTYPSPRNSINSFQFHLVRLKESQQQFFESDLIFQFHLVRLKVLIRPAASVLVSDFNSI